MTRWTTRDGQLISRAIVAECLVASGSEEMDRIC